MTGTQIGSRGVVHLLCRPASRSGFWLAGLDAQVVELQAVEGVVRELLADEEAMVVLIEETLFEALGEETKADLGRRVLPLALPFPGPRWEPARSEAEQYVTEMLRQAIGYQMRLR